LCKTLNRFSAVLEQIASLAPSFANANANARPNPLEAPIIITVFVPHHVISLYLVAIRIVNFGKLYLKKSLNFSTALG